MKIPFNKPFHSGQELAFIQQAIENGHTSGNGFFSRQCHNFFESKYGFKKCLLTSSCTDALEMCAILLDIQPGDEVIVPSFTFVSTANAFVLRGAKIIFADSQEHHPNICIDTIQPLINKKTKAIVVVHYAGVACDMDAIMDLAIQYNLYVVEDAAHAIDSYYKNKSLGGIGHLATFSFHETKNVISGEGGMLVINDDRFVKRSEIIWEKGTNRSAFFKGEVNKYGWVDIGSSFLPSEIMAAFLWAQLELLDSIQKRRREIWSKYYEGLLRLEKTGKLILPALPSFATNNGHMFYVLCTNGEMRDGLIKFLASNGIHSVFHYLPLHRSAFYLKNNALIDRPHADKFSMQLLRLPFYYELSPQEQSEVIEMIERYYA